jgi:hypothetical protein
MFNSNRPQSYKKLTYLQKVSIVNRKLRIGDISRIAEATEYSSTHVSDVLSGKRFNNRILNEAYDTVRGRVSNPERIKTLLQNEN